MDYKHLMKTVLKSHPSRITHTLNVLEVAKELGQIYQANLQTLETAALLHDITKYYKKEQHLTLIPDHQLIKDLKLPLYHPISANYYAKSLGIEDEGVLEAIKYHMWGKIDMKLETMILVVSDYCEPSRTFKQAKDVYKLAKENLLDAYLLAIESTINHLIKTNKTPHNNQLEVYHYYKGEAYARKNNKNH
ncbi:MAG: bis(5'-nucleosyl)-tetraphosphatase (symmetrical) YqeK [Acholeplasmataceae bacterium]